MTRSLCSMYWIRRARRSTGRWSRLTQRDARTIYADWRRVLAGVQHYEPQLVRRDQHFLPAGPACQRQGLLPGCHGREQMRPGGRTPGQHGRYVGTTNTQRAMKSPSILAALSSRPRPSSASTWTRHSTTWSARSAATTRSKCLADPVLTVLYQMGVRLRLQTRRRMASPRAVNVSLCNGTGRWHC